MAKLNVRGNEIIRECHERMAIPFRQNGSLVVAFDDEGMKRVNELYAKGVFNGVPGLRILSPGETYELEKNLAPGVRGASGPDWRNMLSLRTCGGSA